MNDFFEIERATEKPDGPFNVFRCGLAQHRTEIEELLESDVHFRSLFAAVIQFIKMPMSEQQARFDTMSAIIDNYVVRHCDNTWGYYLYIMLCYRTRNVKQSQAYIEHVGRNHMIQHNDGLLFLYLVFYILKTRKFAPCERNLRLRNTDGRWDYALDEIAHYKEHPDYFFKCFENEECPKRKRTWHHVTLCVIN